MVLSPISRVFLFIFYLPIDIIGKWVYSSVIKSNRSVEKGAANAQNCHRLRILYVLLQIIFPGIFLWPGAFVCLHRVTDSHHRVNSIYAISRELYRSPRFFFSLQTGYGTATAELGDKNEIQSFRLPMLTLQPISSSKPTTTIKQMNYERIYCYV